MRVLVEMRNGVGKFVPNTENTGEGPSMRNVKRLPSLNLAAKYRRQVPVEIREYQSRLTSEACLTSEM